MPKLWRVKVRFFESSSECHLQVSRYYLNLCWSINFEWSIRYWNLHSLYILLWKWKSLLGRFVNNYREETSERRKVQATSSNIFYHHFALILLWTERERKNKKKNRKEESFMHMLFSTKQLRINPESRPQGYALRKIEGSPVLWNCKI